MRLFIAIRFSDAVRAALLSAADTLKKASSGGNFTRAENLHLTLAFIGESDDVITVRRVMERCAGERFTLAVGGSGHFGDLYWAGIEKNPALSALADRLQNALRSAGFPVEKRDFSPHITLVRQLKAAFPPRFSVPRTEMAVTAFSLMKSERIAGRLVYMELFSCPLR